MTSVYLFIKHAAFTSTHHDFKRIHNYKPDN